MVIFEKCGVENTDEALSLAFDKAIELGTDVVGASSSGFVAKKAVQIAKEKGFKGKLIIVTLTYGMVASEPGKNRMDDKTREALKEEGCLLVTATHLLSGAERGLSSKFGGVYPVEIIAYTLRMFSQGTKVCVECAGMALDNGAIEYGKPIVAFGGTGHGCDTVAVLTPAHGNNILDTKIHEILCKPY